MKKVLRWGLLGTARINRSLIPPLRVSKRCQLAAVASRSHDKAQEYAREWKIPAAHASYEAMLDDPNIDVIYVSLPNHLHTEWTLKAAAAGKHVLCEKPLGINVVEIEQIIQAAQQNHVHIAEAFMYRHHPQTLRVKEMLENGEIGELRLIQGAFTFMLNRPADIRWNPDHGGGSLWDVGCYPISYMLLAAGDSPVEVMGWQKLSATGIDATFIGQLRFANGLLAQFHCSFELPLFTNMELFGSEGSIHVPSPFKPQQKTQFRINKDSGRNIHIHSDELYSYEVENMADVILEGHAPRMPLAESLKVIRTMTALYQSARTGQPVGL